MRLHPLFALSLLVLGACATATGDVLGGEARFDAAAPAALEAGIVEPDLSGAGPTTWAGLYRDFFGHSAKSSCAGNGTCHGTATAVGSKASNFVCADLAGCWESLRNGLPPQGGKPLVDAADIAAPDGAYLFSVIRIFNPDGTTSVNRNMPQQPRDFAFTPEHVARMKTWITSGANND